jgi:mono/diheme cytochrome c family protein
LTEIPEHLLARSKARRQAIGQDEGGAPAADAPAPSAAVEPAAAAAAPAGPAAAAAPTPAKAPAAPAPPPAKPKAPEVVAAESRRKIPWWAVPALAGLPVWAGIYAFTLEPPTEESLLTSEGAALYSSAGCAGCHGATGGGGVGPAFAGGAILETFSHYEDHIRWVGLGSEGWAAEVGSTYGDTNKPVGGVGIMPAFGGSLTEEEIALIVRYEREVLGGGECEPALAELTGEPCE